MDEMKPWQHGYQLDKLKDLEDFYAPYNRHALSVFGKFKKNDIATRLSKGTLIVHHDELLRPGMSCAYVTEIAKVATKIKMHGATVIGQKLPGDVTFSRLVGNTTRLSEMLDGFSHKDCWLFSFAGDKAICTLAEIQGFQKVGYKVTSFSEIISVYFRQNKWARMGVRVHPVVPQAELVGMAKIAEWDTSKALPILDTIKAMCPVFTNHYSNYNQKDAWSALALRGYLDDPSFITKPAEMNDKWKEEHKEKQFELQDTKVYKYFDEVRELLSFIDGDVHRVRFMRLAPGGGELQRHTDQVDPDAGNSLGALARLHFPLKTNKNVVFSTWNGDDEKENYHYGFGECWVIDTRKPHMAVNGGNEERIHLVVDTVVTPKLERMICDGLSTPYNPKT